MAEAAKAAVLPINVLLDSVVLGVCIAVLTE
jgi:hypothetical protein